MNENVNYGLIEENPDVRDWFASGITGVSDKKVLLENGDWRPFKPTVTEYQAGVYFDTLACVTFSALNNIEILAKYLGIEMNRSERFNAKLSGTTKNGNSLRNVAISIAVNHGTVDESEWPFPRRQMNPVFDWDDYYSEVPQELVDKGLSWLKEYNVKYEWVNVDRDSIKNALKYGPLQVGVYAWPKPGTDGLYTDGGNNRRNHAVTLLHAGDDFYTILDHYDNVEKKLVPTYDFKWAMQFTLIPINEDTNMSDKIQLPNDTLVQLVEAPGGFGLHIDGKLYVDSLDKIVASWLIRNPDFTNPRRATLTKAQWDSFDHYNLKNELIS